MISITTSRSFPDGYEILPTQKRSVSGAFSYLVTAELAFGASISVLTETRIVTVTTLLGMVDTTTFSGTKADMRPLVDVAVPYVFYKDPEASLPFILPDSKRLLGEKLENPLMLSLTLGLSVGNVLLFPTLYAYSGLDVAHAEEVRQKVSPQDFSAVCELSLETGIAIPDLLHDLMGVSNHVS